MELECVANPGADQSCCSSCHLQRCAWIALLRNNSLGHKTAKPVEVPHHHIGSLWKPFSPAISCDQRPSVYQPTWLVSRLIGNWPLPGARTAQSTFLPVALFMSVRSATQLGATHFLEVCRVRQRLAVSRAGCSRKPSRTDVCRCRCAGRNSTLGSQTYKAISAPPAQCHLTQDEKELDKRRLLGPSFSPVRL